MAKKPKNPKTVETLTHDEATRKNIPTAEYQSVMQKDEQSPIRVAYQRRNRDLDPQLVWRGKDEQDESDLVTYAPPLYIQEKVHPKVLIDDLRRRTEAGKQAQPGTMDDLFADFNGLPDDATKTEFYQHDANWANRMILGDSLQVMASLAEREGLRGKVQCIYLDPPYGIKFNSNFQWSTTSRDVKDGNAEHITREPEQVKAFRDTWRDGIHSYLTYLRDRLTVARDLLTDSGSIFVQIGDENIHLVRSLLDEVFGADNFCSQITFRKTAGANSPSAKLNVIGAVSDYVLWYSKNVSQVRYRGLFEAKEFGGICASAYGSVELNNSRRRRLAREEKDKADTIPDGSRIYRQDNLTSPGWSDTLSQPFELHGKTFSLSKNLHWKTRLAGLKILTRANRVSVVGNSLAYIRYIDDFAVVPRQNVWSDTATGGFGEDKFYVVQTVSKVIERCLLMATDPGDLVVDPTCGSGTTAYVAEHWGRRWITIDTSRVALALARARIMGARYPFYLLADSCDGQQKEAEITHTAPSTKPTYGSIRRGFVYERVPHITLKSIANNAEIDVIWDKWQQTLEPLREHLNKALGTSWEEWEIPRSLDEAKRNPGSPSSDSADAASGLLEQWWRARIARQKEIDASIAAKADFETLYDKPYEDKKKVRVAGPFTVESLSPHRVLGVDENDELIDRIGESGEGYGAQRDLGLSHPLLNFGRRRTP
jgi:adenine-specific DNA-methyltransferase